MSTYKVEHMNGTSTLDGVFGISHRDHLLFYTEEGKVFAGFAEGTWHSFAKVSEPTPTPQWGTAEPDTVLSEVDLDSAPTGFAVTDDSGDTWHKVSDGLWSCCFGGVTVLDGYANWTAERLADYGVSVPENPYAVGTVLTKEQFKAAPVGTKASTPEGFLFLRRENGTALVSYESERNRPDMYWRDDDLDLSPDGDTDEFTVVTAP